MLTRQITPAAWADLDRLPAVGRWVTSGRSRLHVLDYGGPGTPLLVLPGITSPAATLDFVARELSDLVRPLVLDVRGRGLSDTGTGHTLTEYAEDAEAVVRELGLERPLLFGHSMGARIAAAVAVRGRVAVRGAVLADPPLSGPGRGPYPTSLAVFQEQLAEAVRGTDGDEVARWWPRWPREEQEARARWLASCDGGAVAASHHGFEHEDFFDWWPRVPCPVTLLYGAQSPVVTAAGAAEAAAALPSARLEQVPDCGHMIFWDNPSGGLRALRRALRRVPCSVLADPSDRGP
ncbi:alpha/beta fold hydrolase [Streptomyces sp. NPDC087440]|uniref:alpha/beta fold hydrolase n=1 Tax=Streptomyces sp. NPDC087440 TaxID=3365790 RepID=UPI0037FD0936